MSCNRMNISPRNDNFPAIPTCAYTTPFSLATINSRTTSHDNNAYQSPPMPDQIEWTTSFIEDSNWIQRAPRLPDSCSMDENPIPKRMKLQPRPVSNPTLTRLWLGGDSVGYCPYIPPVTPETKSPIKSISLPSFVFSPIEQSGDNDMESGCDATSSGNGDKVVDESVMGESVKKGRSKSLDSQSTTACPLSTFWPTEKCVGGSAAGTSSFVPFAKPVRRRSKVAPSA